MFKLKKGKTLVDITAQVVCAAAPPCPYRRRRNVKYAPSVAARTQLRYQAHVIIRTVADDDGLRRFREDALHHLIAQRENRGDSRNDLREPQKLQALSVPFDAYPRLARLYAAHPPYIAGITAGAQPLCEIRGVMIARGFAGTYKDRQTSTPITEISSFRATERNSSGSRISVQPACSARQLSLACAIWRSVSGPTVGMS